MNHSTSDNDVAASSTDIVVIGGGMAGASVAAELAAHASVVLMEREAFFGYHATGRSAASFSENYGSALIRRLAIAGRSFLESPPAGFSPTPLMAPRGMITIARDDQRAQLAAELEKARILVPAIRPISPGEAVAAVPVLRPDYVAAAFLETGACEIDVDALHQGYLRAAKALGARLCTDCPVTAIARRGGLWEVSTEQGTMTRAPVLVNAAGAWADTVAGLAGLAPLGLTPFRRTAFIVDVPEGVSPAGWPLINDVDEAFYFKPDVGRLFVSPGDATPSPPMDAFAEDIDVALGVERLESATTLRVRRIRRSWAGLRTFAPDRAPVVGMAGKGFFWLVGQGGYGIKTAPALSRTAASLILHGTFPSELADLGISPAELSPGRFANAGAAA